MPPVILVLALALLPGMDDGLAAADAQVPDQAPEQQGEAGTAELAMIEARIAALQSALADADATCARLGAALGDWCLDRLGRSVATWEPPPASVPAAADLGGLYAELLRTRLGFDPLGETAPAQRDWGVREAALAEAQAAADRLRASLRRLERLRVRLRRQLGLDTPAPP